MKTKITKNPMEPNNLKIVHDLRAREKESVTLDEQKIRRIIEYSKKPGFCKKRIENMYGIGPSTLGDILKNHNKILDQGNSGLILKTKRKRKGVIDETPSENICSICNRNFAKNNEKLIEHAATCNGEQRKGTVFLKSNSYLLPINYSLHGYILVVLKHTTARNHQWGGDETLKLVLLCVAWLLLS